MKRSSQALHACPFALLGLALFWTTNTRVVLGQDSAPTSSPAVQAPALPQLTEEGLMKEDWVIQGTLMGKPYELKSEDLKNRPVVIDLTANWCVGCKVLAPALKEFIEKNPEALLVVLDFSDRSGLGTSRERLYDEGEKNDAALREKRKLASSFLLGEEPAKGVFRAKFGPKIDAYTNAYARMLGSRVVRLPQVYVLNEGKLAFADNQADLEPLLAKISRK